MKHDPLSLYAGTLRDSTATLNQVADEAAEAVREIEEFLRENGTGTRARVPYSQRTETPNTLLMSPPRKIVSYLEYARVGQGFRIAVSEYANDSVTPSNIKPWSDCTRSQKLASIVKLPDLIVALGKQIQKQIDDAQTAVKSASSVLRALTGQEGIKND